MAVQARILYLLCLTYEHVLELQVKDATKLIDFWKELAGIVFYYTKFKLTA